MKENISVKTVAEAPVIMDRKKPTPHYNGHNYNSKKAVNGVYQKDATVVTF